jgi:hypothetical protein
MVSEIQLGGKLGEEGSGSPSFYIVLAGCTLSQRASSITDEYGSLWVHIIPCVLHRSGRLPAKAGPFELTEME